MKSLFTALILIFCLTTIKGQFVTIPDPNFVAWLQVNTPSAINGNQMDTTSTLITLRTGINVENSGISDLTGVQYFDALKSLNCGNQYFLSTPNTLTGIPRLPSTLDTLICSSNTITSLPPLPNTLTFLSCEYNNLASLGPLPMSIKTLNCSSNQVTGFSTLPDSLKVFNCSDNQLTSFPALPGSLIHLECGANLLTALPSLPNTISLLTCEYCQLTSLPTLPASLSYLRCFTNHITSLPALPAGLSNLQCQANLLTSLPPLPNSLLLLYCSHNAITTLPALPNSLTNLGCSKNLLNSLPALPNSIINLYCDSNSVTALPALPPALELLSCRGNQLTSLPTLPNTLNTLFCENNHISCFNTFNDSITDFTIDHNPFTCLPNYIAAMDVATLAYPLCAPGNLDNCPNAEGIFGYIYKDNNTDCIKNNSDTGLKNVPLRIYDTSNNLLGQMNTVVNGIYSFQQTANTYNVIVDTTGAPFITECNFPGIDSTVTVALLDTNINFAFTCKPGFDIGVRSAITNGWVFPGQQHSLNINAGDMSHWYNLNCAGGVSGQVQLTVTGNVVYNGPAVGALSPIVSGNVYTYNITDFGTVNNAGDFNLLFTTNTNAQAGDAICVNVLVTPTSGDNVIANNTVNFCYYVINSHDPNKKETYPVDVAPGYQDYFTYTIHFQNTGSAPAFNINLIDTLDSNLDLNTFQVTNYSHPNTAQVKGNILSFSFSNIMLADSTSNLAGSQGYVQYRIKPKASWVAPDKIKNTAYIYFDFNAPVITNTTYNSIMTVTGLQKQSADNFSVYPNPNNGSFVIDSHSAESLDVSIVDITGNIVLETTLKNGKHNITANHLAEGIYTISIKGSTGVTNTKMVIIH